MPAKTPTAKTPTKPRKKRRSYRSFPAKVKCEAVLAIWTEKRTPTEVCRDLDIPWQQLQKWQRQALEAMMERLEPRSSPEESRSPNLGKRLQRLIDQTETKSQRKLSRRLTSVQQASAEDSSTN